MYGGSASGLEEGRSKVLQRDRAITASGERRALKFAETLGLVTGGLLRWMSRVRSFEENTAVSDLADCLLG